MIPYNKVPLEYWIGLTAYIPDSADFSLDSLAKELRRELPDIAVDVFPQGIQLTGPTWDGEEWFLWLYDDKGQIDLSEWQEFAEDWGDHPRSPQIASIPHHLEFAATQDEPGGEVGEAVVALLSSLKQFIGVFVLDHLTKEELPK